jgi:cobalt-zinc-cadmium resistance protein CzcA
MVVGIIAKNAIFMVHLILRAPARDGRRGHGHPLRHRPTHPAQADDDHRNHLGPLATGLGAQMQQPLAVAVIGGFVVALPMLLFLLPTGMRLIYHHMRPPEPVAKAEVGADLVSPL